MFNWLVYFLDPLRSSEYTTSYNFTSKEEAQEFIIDDIYYQLTQQENFVSGLKGNKQKHIEKYKNYLYQNDEVYFFGEYNEISCNSEFVYKYWICSK